MVRGRRRRDSGAQPGRRAPGPDPGARRLQDQAHGAETIDYKSGIMSQIDVAVRRHVVSQAPQAGGA